MISSDVLEPDLRPAFEDGVTALCDTGAYFHRQNWSLGTSSNYSIVLQREPLQLLLTASGKDKSRLGRTDYVLVDGQGKSLVPTPEKPSAETLLHTVLAQQLPSVGAVLHTHSVWSTILSDLHGDEGGFWIEGYEMLKGLAGVATHEHRQWVEVFPNTQDIAALSARVRGRLQDPSPLQHGFLIRQHGLYTWGKDLAEARRHVEIFEFLFEVMGRRWNMRK